MTIHKRVPWYSGSEWLDVYQNIFSEDIEKKRLALNRISVWELKSSKVPVAISCTKLFVECHLADISGLLSENQLQMLYGTAIVRFVNTHVDIQQQKLYAESISAAASAIGIPSEIVNCRHEIVHNNMPSLSLLRHTALLCTEYLTVKYWRNQAAVLEGIMNSNRSKHIISGLINLFQAIDSLTMPKDFEISIQTLVQNINQKSVTVRSLMCSAAAIAGSKQKEAIKQMRKLNILGHSTFINIVNWLISFKKTIPRYLQYCELLVHSCSKESFMSSFYHDFALFYFEPTSYASVIVLFWLLARESSHTSLRLVKMIVSYVLSTKSNISTNQNSPNQCITESKSFNKDSFLMWAQLLNVNGKECLSRFSEQNEYVVRLLMWLRIFLLIPVKSPHKSTKMTLNDISVINCSKVSNVSLPLPIEVFLHLFWNCKSDLSFTSSSVVTQDLFTRQLVSNVSIVQSRFIAGCRSMLRPIAIAASECLFAQVCVAESVELLKDLIQIINEADIRISKSNSSRLIEWFYQKYLQASNPNARSKFKKSGTQKFLSKITKDLPQRTEYTLGDQLHNIFWSIRYCALNEMDKSSACLNSQINNLYNDAATNENAQQLSTYSNPWINVGCAYSVGTNELSSEIYQNDENEVDRLTTSPVKLQEKKRHYLPSEDISMSPPEKRVCSKSDIHIRPLSETEDNVALSKYSLLEMLEELHTKFI